MSFNYSSWNNGDVLTADKMNAISGKIILITPTLNADEGRYELGYSFTDIVTMLSNGFLPIVTDEVDMFYVESIFARTNSIEFSTPSGITKQEYSSDTKTDELYYYTTEET